MRGLLAIAAVTALVSAYLTGPATVAPSPVAVAACELLQGGESFSAVTEALWSYLEESGRDGDDLVFIVRYELSAACPAFAEEAAAFSLVVAS